MGIIEQWGDQINELHTAPEPSPEERVKIEELIKQEVAKNPPPKNDQGLHSSLKSLPEFKFTPMMTEALGRVAAGENASNSSIDISRYASIDFESEDPQEQRENLKKAYVAMGYTQIRRDNLDIMSLLAKNQWLLANDATESDLLRFEQEVINKQNESANIARQYIKK
ncbi:Pre-mRNA-splicing factor SPF27 [Dipodascopsis uninucleata]